MKKFWTVFFMFWPVVAIVLFAIAPAMNWWFPSDPMTPIGIRIDGLFYMILIIVAVTFVLTHVALGYVLWKGADEREGKALFTHGSHNLEVIWTIVPAGILLFIALYQMDVWAAYRVKETYDAEARLSPVAEVTARQFEWRIRYPGIDENGNPLELMPEPQPTDLYTVNDLHLPSGHPVMINLRSDDVQHSFFLPELRVKQDAVPGLVIPIWFEAMKSAEYPLLCAELCGWGHYKMKARFVAEPEEDWRVWLRDLHTEQTDDGVPDEEE